MRATLDALYDAAAWLAAACMIGVLVMVLLSIAGRQFGFYVPGTDAYAGYLMAGSSFLALAHTLKRNEHIRVTLLLNLSPPAMRRALQLWSLGMAVLLSGLLGWYSARLAWQSRQFHDISTGADADFDEAASATLLDGLEDGLVVAPLAWRIDTDELHAALPATSGCFRT